MYEASYKRQKKDRSGPPQELRYVAENDIQERNRLGNELRMAPHANVGNCPRWCLETNRREVVIGAGVFLESGALAATRNAKAFTDGESSEARISWSLSAIFAAQGEGDHVSK